MGLTMQTLIVAIQAAAPLQDIGAATGIITQARTVGASLGLALNGAIMVLGLTTFSKTLPADVAAVVPGGLSALAPKVVDALPDATRDVVLHAYYLGFTPVYWFAGAVYLLTVVLTLLLPDVTIPKHATR
jgi:hypothetical protein